MIENDRKHYKMKKDSSWQRSLKRHLEADHFNPASSVFNVNHVNTHSGPSRT